MNTKRFGPDDVVPAAEIIRGGGLLGITTETVYGLGANGLDPEAVANIFAAKGRPQDNPLILHIPSAAWLERYCRNISDAAYALADRFWPGPLTMILERGDMVPDVVTAGLDTVGMRCPAHPVCRAILTAADLPVAAPSGNTSGRPSPTTAQHMLEDMDGKIDGIVDGGPCNFGVESTVITLAGDHPRLLRPGAVTLEQLEAAIGAVEVDHAVTGQLEEGQVAASPGMKYKHYSPKALVYLVRGSAESFRKYVNALPGENIYAMVFAGEGEGLRKPFREYGAETDHLMQARELFWLLREFDDLGAQAIYVRCPSTDGVGLAVYNRLIRAAAFKFIDLD